MLYQWLLALGQYHSCHNNTGELIGSINDSHARALPHLFYSRLVTRGYYHTCSKTHFVGTTTPVLSKTRNRGYYHTCSIWDSDFVGTTTPVLSKTRNSWVLPHPLYQCLSWKLSIAHSHHSVAGSVWNDTLISAAQKTIDWLSMPHLSQTFWNNRPTTTSYTSYKIEQWQ